MITLQNPDSHFPDPKKSTKNCLTWITWQICYLSDITKFETKKVADRQKIQKNASNIIE